MTPCFILTRSAFALWKKLSLTRRAPPPTIHFAIHWSTYVWSLPDASASCRDKLVQASFVVYFFICQEFCRFLETDVFGSNVLLIKHYCGCLLLFPSYCRCVPRWSYFFAFLPFLRRDWILSFWRTNRWVMKQQINEVKTSQSIRNAWSRPKRGPFCQTTTLSSQT